MTFRAWSKKKLKLEKEQFATWFDLLDEFSRFFFIGWSICKRIRCWVSVDWFLWPTPLFWHFWQVLIVQVDLCIFFPKAVYIDKCEKCWVVLTLFRNRGHFPSVFMSTPAHTSGDTRKFMLTTTFVLALKIL